MKNPTKKPYHLRCRFSGSMDDIEMWLGENCIGLYEYSFEDIVETEAVFNQLVLLFEFQHSVDRERFKDAIKSGAI